MKCENCGARIRKWESYCPKCGMELFNSDSKPLQKKYLRGEYREVEEISTEPYDLGAEDLSEATYNQDTYQNPNYNQDNQDEDSQKGNRNQNNRNRNYKQEYNKEGNSQKKYQRGYDLDEYYESEKTGGSIWGTVILMLIVALLFGFVMGVMFFSTKI